MQAEIRDDAGQERLGGEGVIYEVYINDIENFEDPAVDWAAIGPANQVIVRIDGDRATAGGSFDDLRTDLEIEAVPGTLDATCGNQRFRGREVVLNPGNDRTSRFAMRRSGLS